MQIGMSREIARPGSQLDAARATIEAVFGRMPDLQFGLASEGSYGPHPCVRFAPLEREIVVLVDRTCDLELVGYHATPDTNFAHRVVADIAGGLDLVERVEFSGSRDHRDGLPRWSAGKSSHVD
jgi:hypothetical protein